MTDSRERVLAAVTQALGDERGRMRQPPPVRDLGEAGDPASLATRFAAELSALLGTCMIGRDRAECTAAMAEYLKQRAVSTIAVQSQALAHDIGARLLGFDVRPASTMDKAALERVDCSLLGADSLLADTGSAIVVLDNGSDRVLPYLPRTCVIVAGSSALHSTMSVRAIGCIQQAAERKTAGEALIVAGPSRTADIEKILVLGAHGPQNVAVVIIENE